MRPLSLEELRDLCSPRSGPCLSLYMPVEHAPGSAEANRIRFKGLVQRCLGASEAAASRAERNALAELLATLTEHEPWTNAARGLAVFVAPDGERHFALPQPLPELAICAGSFHLRPLIRLFASNRRYFLLTLSMRHARLYRGTNEGVAPAELPGLAHAVADAVPVHRSARGGAGGVRSVGGSSVHYGHAPAHSEDESDVVHYLKAVDRALHVVLRDERAPLVTACTDELVAPWRRINSFPALLEPVLSGNFDAASAATLHAKAWPLVEARAREVEERALEAFGAEAPRGRSSAELSTIARAAVQGRVRDLFLADEEQLPGVLDRDSGEIRKPVPGAPADDVYDDLAEAVLLRGGEVHALPRARMPRHVPIAASFRW